MTDEGIERDKKRNGHEGVRKVKAQQWREAEKGERRRMEKCRVKDTAAHATPK